MHRSTLEQYLVDKTQFFRVRFALTLQVETSLLTLRKKLSCLVQQFLLLAEISQISYQAFELFSKDNPVGELETDHWHLASDIAKSSVASDSMSMSSHLLSFCATNERFY